MNAVVQMLLQSRWRKQLLQTAAVLGGCLLLASLAVLLAMNSRANAQAENLLEQEAAAGAEQSDVAGTVHEGELSQLVAETTRLQKAGFGAPADRVAWVDAAVRTLDRLHPIAYTVEAGTLQSQTTNASLQQRYQELGLEPPEFERNDLLLTVQGLHEDELLAAIDEIASQGGGIVRPEFCKFTRRSDGVGLDAQCTLRRYRLRQPTAQPAS